MQYTSHNKEEHSEAKKLLKKIEKSKEDKKELFRELFVMIHAHHTSEEAVIFPVVKERAKKKDTETLLEMIEEHNLIKYQFSLVDRTSEENETWDAKFSVLKEILEHHLKEEVKEFSPIVDKLIPDSESEELMVEFEKIYAEKEAEKKKELSEK